MTAARWLAALIASAVLAIASAPWALDVPWLNVVFKPLATLAVIGYAAGRGDGAPRRWVLIGLVLSLIGDVALLWPREGFLPGLVAFLLAHGAYLIAFTRVAPFASPAGPFVAYALVAGAILSQLWHGVPAGLRGPVVVYVVALFVVSDALLATNRFAVPVPAASLGILGTYWAAQGCIASWLAPRQ